MLLGEPAIAFVAHWGPLHKPGSIGELVAVVDLEKRQGQLVSTKAPATTPYDLHSICAHLTAAS